MKFYRLYSGDDGQSHFEKLDSSQSSDFFNATRQPQGCCLEMISRLILSIGIERRDVAGSLPSPVQSTSGLATAPA